MRRAFRPESVAVFGECRVPSALQNLHDRLLDQAISTVGMPSFRTPPSGFRDSHPSHRFWLVGPRNSCSRWRASAASGGREISDFHAVDSRTSFVRFDWLERREGGGCVRRAAGESER